MILLIWSLRASSLVFLLFNKKKKKRTISLNVHVTGTISIRQISTQSSKTPSPLSGSLGIT